MVRFRKALVEIGPELFPMLLEVKKADALAQSMYKREEKLQEINDLWDLYHRTLEENNCLCLKDLALDGKDLISLGMKPGKELGETLQLLFDYVLENPQKNSKEDLLLYLEQKNPNLSKEADEKK